MAITVRRPNLNLRERLYLPAILSGMAITLRHFKNMLFGRTKVTTRKRNGTAICRNIIAVLPRW